MCLFFLTKLLTILSGQYFYNYFKFMNWIESFESIKDKKRFNRRRTWFSTRYHNFIWFYKSETISLSCRFSSKIYIYASGFITRFIVSPPLITSLKRWHTSSFLLFLMTQEKNLRLSQPFKQYLLIYWTQLNSQIFFIKFELKLNLRTIQLDSIGKIRQTLNIE